jgi:PAS domain S-box-containing protein
VEASNQRLRDIIDGVAPSMFVGLLTPQGILIEANLPALAAGGLHSKDVIGKPFEETYWWSYSREIQEQLRAAISRAALGEASRYDTRIRAAENEFIDIDFSLQPLRGEAGKVVYLIPSASIMTERKRAEEELRWKSAFLEAQVDSSLDGMLVVDAQGRIILQNQRLVDLWQIPAHIAAIADDAVMMEFASQRTKKPEQFFDKVSYLYSHPDEVSQDEIELVDGTVLDRYSSPVRDKAGKHYGRIWTFRDLTERKKLEQQFLRTQRVESIGTLASGIAHDLNNVLGPIMLSLGLLHMKCTDPASQELISLIANCAQRGAAMVSQVLSFARGVEGERLELQLAHIIRDVEKIANDTFPKHIQIRTIAPHNLWTILGDPTQLHQVLLNLCVNARDAMPNGGQLTISAENLTMDTHYAGLMLEARPGPYVLLRVEDTGTGIPAEVIEKIFDPFFTTKEVGKGTGLGLSTTLAIVKSHSGFIRVYSEPNKGTTFKVYLPALPEGRTASAVPEIAAERPRGNGELVLVVDDEATVREVTKQTLEAFGYRVALASDGAEGVAVFASNVGEVAAVLTDIMMPVMDGVAAIPVFQRINSKVPIIAASGLSANRQVTQLASLGVIHFLAKPYTTDDLLKTLRQALVGDPGRSVSA